MNIIITTIRNGRMTTTKGRKAQIKLIRRLVRGLGVIKRVHLMRLPELRQHASDLLINRRDWLTQHDTAVIEAFVKEVY